MSKENLGFVERAIRKALPVTELAMLAFAGLCTKDAKAKFAAKYPNVKISDNPTLEELQGAVVILEAKESEGPDFMQGEFDGCMKKNFDDVVAGLEINQRKNTVNLCYAVNSSTVAQRVAHVCRFGSYHVYAWQF